MTLYKWRKRGVGPGYLKLDGGMVRYPAEAVDEYMAQRFVLPGEGAPKVMA